MKVTLQEAKRMMELANIAEAEPQASYAHMKPFKADIAKMISQLGALNDKIEGGGPLSEEIADAIESLGELISNINTKGNGPVTRQMTGDPDADFMGEAVSTDFAKAALELVTLAKNLISRAGESLVMNSEVKKASMITDEDGLSELYYHLQDVLGELIGSEARAFTREAKKIVVNKYGITMTDEYGRKMTWS
jgi:hypothetical protein